MPLNITTRKKNRQINLIPKDEFENSTLGRALRWMLSTFRVAVIITELIVMAAFISRFWLDAKNSDLNEHIDIDKAQILAYSDTESEFRSLQKRLSMAQSLFLSRKNTKILDEITKLIPPDVIITSLSVTDNILQVKATSGSEMSIAQFLINLEENSNFEKVSLSQMVSVVGNESLTNFTISGEIK